MYVGGKLDWVLAADSRLKACSFLYTVHDVCVRAVD